MNFASIIAQNESSRLRRRHHWTLIPRLLVDSIWRPFRAQRNGWLVPRVETLG
jgi:hypothetical protein